jgi:hypothetical protein
VVSGGTQSRVFYSKDKGKTWQVFDTPIVQGEAMTGIFTADFYNEKIGIIAGGNYEKPEQNFQNKAMTFDAGAVSSFYCNFFCCGLPYFSNQKSKF